MQKVILLTSLLLANRIISALIYISVGDISLDFVSVWNQKILFSIRFNL